MRRLTERARIATVLSVVLVSCVVLGGCDQLDGRNRTRRGNRLFRDTQFIDAAAQYERALKLVDDVTIHYNLGLAYSKVFKAGFDGPVLLGVKDEFVCQAIPGVRLVQSGACVKEGDRHYAECGAAKSAPLEKQIAELTSQLASEADEAKKKELDGQRRDKQEELARYTCPSSYQCVEGTFCSLTSPELADIAAQHLQTWIKAQPSDEEIKKDLVDANKDLEEAKAANNQSHISSAQRHVEDLSTKDLTRVMMTRLWMDSEQYRKALDYWEGLLKERPNDSAILGILAGIWLASGDWRKSIELHNKVADLVTDTSGKIAEYQYIGNIAWAKLNTKTLIGVDAIELADRAIGALQRAHELLPKNSALISLEGSIFNFRSTAHGASWAAAIDRATAQDLSQLRRVLAEEAKNAQQGQGQPPAGGAPAAGTPAGGAPAGGAPAAGTPAAGTPGAGTPAGGAPGTPAAGSGAAGDGKPAPASSNPPPATGGAAEKSGG